MQTAPNPSEKRLAPIGPTTALFLEADPLPSGLELASRPRSTERVRTQPGFGSVLGLRGTSHRRTFQRAATGLPSFLFGQIKPRDQKTKTQAVGYTILGVLVVVSSRWFLVAGALSGTLANGRPASRAPGEQPSRAQGHSSGARGNCVSEARGGS